MAEPYPGTQAIVGGGSTLDIYVDTGKHLSLIDGGPGRRRIANGEKGPFSDMAERFAHIALDAAQVELEPLGVLNDLNLELHVGGGAANCAAGAAHLGEQTRLVTILGNGDQVSQLIRQQLALINGLDLDAVNAGDEHKPRLGINLKRSKLENRVWLVQAQPEIPEDKQMEFLGRLSMNSVDAKFVALSSLQPNLLAPALASVSKSIPRAVNPASAWFGNGESKARMPELKELLYGSELTMVALNNDEIAAIHGDDDNSVENAIIRAREMSQKVGIVVCTFGMQGSIAIADKGKQKAFRYPPNVPDELFADNGGAGDASFIGTMVGVSRGLSLDAAVNMGLQSAGLAIIHRGAHAYVQEDRHLGLSRLAA